VKFFENGKIRGRLTGDFIEQFLARFG